MFQKDSWNSFLWVYLGYETIFLSPCLINLLSKSQLLEVSLTRRPQITWRQNLFVSEQIHGKYRGCGGSRDLRGLRMKRRQPARKHYRGRRGGGEGWEEEDEDEKMVLPPNSAGHTAAQTEHIQRRNRGGGGGGRMKGGGGRRGGGGCCSNGPVHSEVRRRGWRQQLCVMSDTRSPTTSTRSALQRARPLSIQNIPAVTLGGGVTTWGLSPNQKSFLPSADHPSSISHWGYLLITAPPAEIA